MVRPATTLPNTAFTAPPAFDLVPCAPASAPDCAAGYLGGGEDHPGSAAQPRSRRGQAQAKYHTKPAKGMAKTTNGATHPDGRASARLASTRASATRRNPTSTRRSRDQRGLRGAG